MAATTATRASSNIKFYTNPNCPWAQRAQIALKELDVPYEEEIIDLGTPRPEWYLKINPRGLVPSLIYNGDGLHDEILTESSVVAQFLADAYPSHLSEAATTGGPRGALTRARINFFVDTFFTKIQPAFYPMLTADNEEDKEKHAQAMVTAIKNEIEPLLKDAGAFFGGSSKLTMAEVLTAPFVIRFATFGDSDLFPASFKRGVDNLPNYSKWAAALSSHENVRFNYDSQSIVESTKKRIAKMKSQTK
ncbi:hypothetical protein ANO11243_078630 [Dothideomycetidae sp. 11243]|nr:hypothetical protein ANO11243_078630 [fungal sp. No.11243]